MMSLLCFAVLAVLLKSYDCQVSHAMNSRLNYFDTDLLRYAAEDKPGNVMLSPASIKSVLAMLLEGAGGETAREIRSALRLSPNKADFREQLNAYLLSLRAGRVGNSGGSQLENANAVFLSNSLQVNKDYESMLRNVYLSEIANVNFMHPVETASTINNWVDKKTRGLISGIVNPLTVDPLSNVMVVNALYFKSDWLKGFDPLNTKKYCFYNKGKCTPVAMMESLTELNYAYVENLRAHAVELPYLGGRYSMILLVPQERDGHGTLIRDLPYMSLPQISALMEKMDVQLALPRFTVDYEEDMVSVLKNMKINSIFSKSSNLSGIFKGKSSQITNVLHKVHLEVDEKGTVAAATTGAVVIPLISSAIQLDVDRPFIFFIRDNELGLVLFEGKIEEPTAATSSFGDNQKITVQQNLQSQKKTSKPVKLPPYPLQRPQQDTLPHPPPQPQTSQIPQIHQRLENQVQQQQQFLLQQQQQFQKEQEKILQQHQYFMPERNH